MHPAAFTYVKHARDRLPPLTAYTRVLEIGSYNVNGTIRELFRGTQYRGMDARKGPGVDLVHDATKFFPLAVLNDVVVCCETLEHAENWPAVVKNAAAWLRPGGVFIGTAAGVGRPPHLCSGAPMPDPPPEFYQNIAPEALDAALRAAGFSRWEIDTLADDIRWTAYR